MTRDNQPINRDEWLAAFADQALEDRVDDLSTVGSDPEMRALAETILRLKHAFPKEELSLASIQRKQANVLERWRGERQKKASWLNFTRLDWLSPSRRRQLAMTAALVAVVGILVVVTPILFSGGAVTGSAGLGTQVGMFMWIMLGILVVAFLWLLRRKP
ncbi:MAG: hypothetical protein HYZ23_06930 [Chloroflexi bacterium]|nr:hypothetical protein [Chloroflexota bacterium]